MSYGRPLLALPLALAALIALPAAAAAAERAFVTVGGEDGVVVIDAETEAVTGTIEGLCEDPQGIAMTPDGKTAYVACKNDDVVVAIDTETETQIGAPIEVGTGKRPWRIAVSPTEPRAYVLNQFDASVSVIDTETNTLAGPDIAVGSNPSGVAFKADGSRAYVANRGSSDVSVIDTEEEEVVGTISTIGPPQSIATAGSLALLPRPLSDDVIAIDLETEAVVGSPIGVGDEPVGIAVRSDNAYAYVTNNADGSVSEIEIESAGGTVTETTAVGEAPQGIAIAPDDERGYVANFALGTVSVIDTSAGVSTTGVGLSRALPGGGSGGVGTSGVVGAPIPVGSFPVDIAFTSAPGPEGESPEEPEEETPSEEEGGGSEGGSLEGGGAGGGSAASTSPAAGSSASGAAGSATPEGALPPPVLGKSVDVEPAKGVVKTKCKGQKRFTPLRAGVRIPLGCLVDTRHGTVVLTAASGRGGGAQTAKFWSGLFRVGQTGGRRPYTTLALGGSLGCGGKRRNNRRHGSRRGSRRHGSQRGPRRRAQASRRRHKKGRGGGRSLWGSGKGRFRTKGRYGSASVRGTIWFVADRCDNSTLFRVRRGVVRVHDDALGRNLNLRAGHSYVARPGRKRGRR